MNLRNVNINNSIQEKFV